MLPATLITATGGRPSSFALCIEYVARQIWKPLQWIVVDDAEVVSPIPSGSLPSSTTVTRLHLRPCWKPGDNTLARNLLAAIPYIKNDVVLFIEDDDWYSPNYVMSQMLHLGEHNLIVGEIPAHYYHFPKQRYWVLDNHDHASLCQTAIRREILPELEAICKTPQDEFIDVRLWETKTQGALYSSKECVGIKGLSGRPGIGIGHRLEESDHWIPDPAYNVLKQWIGEADVNRYVGEIMGLPSTKEWEMDTQGDFPKQTDFEEFIWKGQKRFRCNKVWESGSPCEFDCYDLQGIIDHTRQPHNYSGLPERTHKKVSPLVDSSGKQIIHEEPPKEFTKAKFRTE